MKRILALGLVILSGCATSTEGLTKNQIADRERARNARISFYAQFTSSLAKGVAESYMQDHGYKK